MIGTWPSPHLVKNFEKATKLSSAVLRLMKYFLGINCNFSASISLQWPSPLAPEQGALLGPFPWPLPLHTPVLALAQATQTPGAEDCNFTFHCRGEGQWQAGQGPYQIIKTTKDEQDKEQLWETHYYSQEPFACINLDMYRIRRLQHDKGRINRNYFFI